MSTPRPTSAPASKSRREDRALGSSSPRTPAYLQPTASSSRKTSADVGGAGDSATVLPLQRMNSSRRNSYTSDSGPSLTTDSNGAAAESRNTSRTAPAAVPGTTPPSAAPQQKDSLPSRLASNAGASTAKRKGSASAVHSPATREAGGGKDVAVKEGKQRGSKASLPPLSPSTSSLSFSAAAQPSPAHAKSDKTKRRRDGAESRGSKTPSPPAGSGPPSKDVAKSRSKRRGSSKKAFSSAEPGDSDTAAAAAEARRVAEREDAISASLLAGGSPRYHKGDKDTASASVSFSTDTGYVSMSSSAVPSPKKLKPDGGETPTTPTKRRRSVATTTKRERAAGTPESGGSGSTDAAAAAAALRAEEEPAKDIASTPRTPKNPGRRGSSSTAATTPPPLGSSPHHDTPTTTATAAAAKEFLPSSAPPQLVVEKLAPPSAGTATTPRGVERMKRPATPRAQPSNAEASAAIAAAAAVAADSGGAAPRLSTPLKTNPFQSSTGSTNRAASPTSRRASCGHSATPSPSKQENTVWVAMPVAVRTRGSQELPPIRPVRDASAHRNPEDEEGASIELAAATVNEPNAMGSGSLLPTMPLSTLATTSGSATSHPSSLAAASPAEAAGGEASPPPRQPTQSRESTWTTVGDERDVAGRKADGRVRRRGSRHNSSYGDAKVDDDDDDAEQAAVGSNPANMNKSIAMDSLTVCDPATAPESLPKPLAIPLATSQPQQSDEEEFSLLLEESTRQGGLSDLTGHSPLTAKQRLHIQTVQRLERQRRRKRMNPTAHSLQSSPRLRYRSAASSFHSRPRSAPSTLRNGDTTPSVSPAPTTLSNDHEPSELVTPLREVSVSSSSFLVSAPADGATAHQRVPTRDKAADHELSRRTSPTPTHPESKARAAAERESSNNSSSSSSRLEGEEENWITTEERIIAPTTPLMTKAAMLLRGADTAGYETTPARTMPSVSVLVQSGSGGECGHGAIAQEAEEEGTKVTGGDAQAQSTSQGGAVLASTTPRTAAAAETAKSTRSGNSTTSNSRSVLSTRETTEMFEGRQTPTPRARGSFAAPTAASLSRRRTSDVPKEGDATAASTEAQKTAAPPSARGSPAAPAAGAASPGPSGGVTPRPTPQDAARRRQSLGANTSESSGQPPVPRSAGVARKLSSGAAATAAPPATGSMKCTYPIAHAAKATAKTDPGSHTGSPTGHVKQVLIPLLANAAEKERTATVVFDLDETLCNNHVLGPALLRPGAVHLLKYLRSLYPRPLYKPLPVKSTTDRLYDEALKYTGIFAKAPNAAANARAEDPSYEGLRLEIVLWTASVEAYARPVVARLDPANDIFDQHIFRDVRWYSNMNYTKDLSRLGRSMERCVIVENAPASVYMNRHNAILVHDFVSNRQDRQLFVVKAVLTEWLEKVHKYLLCRAREAAEANSPPALHTSASLDEGGESAIPSNDNSGVVAPEGEQEEDGREDPAATQAKQERLMRRQSVHERLSSPRNLVMRSSRPVSGAVSASLPTLASPPSHSALSIAIASFLSNHMYIAPGTNSIKMTALAHVARKIRAEKAAAHAARDAGHGGGDEDDGDGYDEGEDAEGGTSATGESRTTRARKTSLSTPSPAATRTTRKVSISTRAATGKPGATPDEKPRPASVPKQCTVKVSSENDDRRAGGRDPTPASADASSPTNVSSEPMVPPLPPKASTPRPAAAE